MSMNDPLVSVVIPCLNRAHYLVPTLESVLQQDYPMIECIVVDGGSSDGTVEVLRHYHDRIKWVSEPDKGHADAINKGWWMSKGELLAWLNADDCYVVPDAIAKAVAYLQENPDVDLVYGDYSEIDEEGRLVRSVIRPRAWDLVYAVRHCHYTIPQATSLIRRSILQKVGWLDVDFGNCKDHELWLRIGMAGTIRYGPFHLAHVRICRGLSQQLDVGEAKVRVTQKFLQQPGLPAPFDSVRFRQRALSNSYLVGAVHTWVGARELKTTLAYLRQALVADPLNSPMFAFSVLRRQWRNLARRYAGHSDLGSGGSPS
jgi:hypothetical protein